MNRTGSVRSILLGLALLVSGVSCADSAEQPEFTLEEGFARALLLVSDSNEVDQVFDELYILEEELTAACMNAEGFDYIATRPETTTTDTMDLRAQETVEQYGFFISTFDFNDIQTATSPNSPVYSSLTVDEQQVWNDSHSACQTRSRDEVTASYRLDDILADTERIFDRIENDASVLAAKDGWVACMRNQGIDATSEEALIATLTEQFATVPADKHAEFKAEEIRTALISLDCRQPLELARAEAIAREVQALNPTWADAINQ